MATTDECNSKSVVWKSAAKTAELS